MCFSKETAEKPFPCSLTSSHPQVVREYGDGSCVVRDLSPEEKEEFDKKRSPGLLKLALSRSRSRSPR